MIILQHDLSLSLSFKQTQWAREMEKSKQSKSKQTVLLFVTMKSRCNCNCAPTDIARNRKEQMANINSTPFLARSFCLTRGFVVQTTELVSELETYAATSAHNVGTIHAVVGSCLYLSLSLSLSRSIRFWFLKQHQCLHFKSNDC